MDARHAGLLTCLMMCGKGAFVRTLWLLPISMVMETSILQPAPTKAKCSPGLKTRAWANLLDMTFPRIRKPTIW